MDFQKMWMMNRDGVGMMYLNATNEIVVEKMLVNSTLELKRFYNEVYLPVFNDISNSDICVHFRYATDGDVNEQNCHPFLFENKYGPFALMHNGVMPSQYRNYSIAEDYESSDTANFIQDFLLQEDMDFDSYDVKKIIEEIGMNKLVILSPERLNIINGQLFRNNMKKDGNFYSNLNWEFGSRYYYQDKQYQLWHK